MSGAANAQGDAGASPPTGVPQLGTPAKIIIGAIGAALLGLGGSTGALIVLALLGIPLFAIMGGGAALAWATYHDVARQHVRFIAGDVLQDKFAGSPILVTIPLFTFVGYMMAESKTPERIVRASRAFFGWMPGGLAIVCICASAFFTTLTGASGVTIVAIGGLLYPALRQQKYPDNFSLGLVTTGGSLGLLLPPALPMLVYSLVAGVPLKETFKAGALPGLLVMVVLAGYSAYIGWRAKIPTSPPNLREMGASLWLIKWEMMVPVIILGGLASGLTGLDESAAVTALYVLIIEVFVYKDLSLKKDLPRIAKSSMSLAGAVILILAMANALMNYVDFVKIPELLLEWLETHTSLDTSWKFLIGLNVFLLVIGMLMDGFSAILVAVPLIIPIATTFRMSPFHLGMIFLLNLEIAYVCPPLGLNLYIASFRFERPVVSLYRVVLPFVGLLVVCLGVVTYVPRVSTYLLEGEINEERSKDGASVERCERPTFDYDRLSCVQSDPLNRKPCDARSERIHCLASPSNDADDPEFKAYCVQAYKKTCIAHGWKDPHLAEACAGKPWADQYADQKLKCDAKNGIAPAPSSAAPAASTSAAASDDDALMNDLMGAPSASAKGAASGSPAPSASAKKSDDDDLLKELEK